MKYFSLIYLFCVKTINMFKQLIHIIISKLINLFFSGGLNILDRLSRKYIHVGLTLALFFFDIIIVGTCFINSILNNNGFIDNNGRIIGNKKDCQINRKFPHHSHTRQMHKKKAVLLIFRYLSHVQHSRQRMSQNKFDQINNS